MSAPRSTNVVEHAAVRGVRHAEREGGGCHVGAAAPRCRSGSTSSRSQPRCASLTPNASIRSGRRHRASRPCCSGRASRARRSGTRRAPGCRAARLVDFTFDGPVKYLSGLRGDGAAWSFDPWTKTPGMPRSGSNATRRPRSPSAWPRLSPVLTTRSGCELRREPRSTRCLRRCHGAMCASERCSTRIGAVPAGRMRQLMLADREQVALDADAPDRGARADRPHRCRAR